MPVQSGSSNYYRALSIIYNALLTGQVMMALIATVLVYTGNLNNHIPELENVFFIVSPLLIIMGRLAGNTIFGKKLEQAQNENITADKLTIYRSACITRYALLEGGVLFSIMCFLLTSKYELLAFAGGGLLLFMMLRPSKEKIASELKLSIADIENA